jgi:acid phosphatase type 7
MLSLVVSFLAWPGGSALAVASWSDGFEAGLPGTWTSFSGLTTQTTFVHGGSLAARSTGSVAWASKTLPDVTSDVEVSLWFRFQSRQSPVWLTRLRTGSNGNLMKVMVNNGGKLVYRNDVAGVTRSSTKVVTNVVWHHLEAHVTVAGANGHVQISLDGVPVPGLDRVESMGTSPVGRVEVGNRPTGKTYDLAIDDVDVTDIAGTGAVQPPTAVTIDDPGGVDLSWTPPASGPAPGSYRIYRDNALVGTVIAPATTFSDPGANDDVTRYLYSVTSVASGDESAPSGFEVAESPTFGSGDAVVYAAGDIVCKPGSAVTATACRHGQTADVVAAGAGDAVVALGDLQYEIGKPSDYTNAYHPTWGRAKAITVPVVGNHEYFCKTTTQGCSYPAAGYFGYFGAAAGDPDEGWYRDEVAGWTVLSLNSNCNAATPMKDFTDCEVGSPQYQWVQQQLATDGQCTMVLWHHPRFSSGDEHGDSPWMQDLWALAANQSVELLLVGHEHIYQRFAPRNASGAMSSPGLRQFTVGIGGKDLSTAPENPVLPSEAITDDAFGVLKLTLHANGYDYDFVPAWGESYADTGSGTCA